MLMDKKMDSKDRLHQVFLNNVMRLIATASPVSMEGEDDPAKAEEAKRLEEARKLEESRREKKYSQAEFDAMSKTQREQYEERAKKTADRERKLSEDKRLTEQERDEARQRAEAIENEFKSQKQIEAERFEKLQKQYTEKEKALKEENESLKNSLSATLIDTELAQETALAEEMVPGQLKKFLRPDTTLVDEVDEGLKPTGKKVVRVKLEDTDKEGKPVVHQLSVKEALKRMKEKPDQYGNFFKGVGTGGVGSGNGKGASVGSSEMPKDTEAYLARRAAKKAEESGTKK